MINRYPEYKDSGVGWIGDMPKNWKVTKIKHTLSNLIGGVWGTEPQGNENDIYCIRVADFDYVQLTLSTYNLTLRNISPKERSKRVLRNNDLLIEKSGGGEKTPVGRTIMFDGGIPRLSVSSNFISKVSVKSDSCFPKYLLYCLNSMYQLGLTRKHIKQSTGLQNLDIDSYFQEKIPFSSLVQQAQIANFLDHKTQQIDKLIHAKERKIELLQEYRASLIHQAVTKGLDPNVEMKPSEVEWIGEIPRHWKVIRNRFIFQQIKDVGHPNLMLLSIGVKGVRPKNQTGQRDVSSDDKSLYKKVRIGDIAFNVMTAWKGGIGMSEYEGIVSPAYQVCRPCTSLVAKYFHYLFRTDLYKAVF